jgi:hypothetical protein
LLPLVDFCDALHSGVEEASGEMMRIFALFVSMTSSASGSEQNESVNWSMDKLDFNICFPNFVNFCLHNRCRGTKEQSH